MLYNLHLIILWLMLYLFLWTIGGVDLISIATIWNRKLYHRLILLLKQMNLAPWWDNVFDIKLKACTILSNNNYISCTWDPQAKKEWTIDKIILLMKKNNAVLSPYMLYFSLNINKTTSTNEYLHLYTKLTLWYF